MLNRTRFTRLLAVVIVSTAGLMHAAGTFAQSNTPRERSATQQDAARARNVPSAEAAQSRRKAARHTVIVIRSRPVKGIAEVMEATFSDSDGLRIVVDTESNTLLLSGPQEVIDDAVQLIRTLDQPPRTITVTAEIFIDDGHATDGADKSHLMVDRLTLSTLDEIKGMLQSQQDVAVTTGMTMAASGRGVPQMQRQQVGTLLQVTPRIADNHIALALSVEKSWIETPKSDSTEGETQLSFHSPSMHSSVLQTTLQLEPGQPQTIRSRVSGDGDSSREVVVTITATIDNHNQPGEGRSGGFRPSDGRPTDRRGPPFGPGAAAARGPSTGGGSHSNKNTNPFGGRTPFSGRPPFGDRPPGSGTRRSPLGPGDTPSRFGRSPFGGG